MEPTFQWSTNGYKDQEKSDHSITQDVGNNSQWDWDWTMSDIDWQRVFEEEGEGARGKCIDLDSGAKEAPPSSSSSPFFSSSSTAAASCHNSWERLFGGGSGYDNLFLQCEGVDLTLPGKRRIRRVDNIPFPKILKSDFRHKLSLMFANAMNSVDCNFVRGFYEEFCVRGCQYTSSSKTEEASCSIFLNYKPVHVYGMDDFVRRYASICSELPDYCFHLAHSYINRQIDLPGSRIVMKIASRGTAVKHNMIAVQGIDKKRYLIPCFVLDGLVKAGLVDVNDMSIEEHPFDAQHMEMNLAGETIFWLDNNHRIYHIEAHGGVSLRYCRCDC